MAPDRWVVLDDNDPAITYVGSWFQDTGSKDSIGNFGPPYQHTLHGTSIGGSVHFEFNGTKVEVWGTNIVKNPKTNPDPNFECFIDDVSIGRDAPLEFPENNWSFCTSPPLGDGPHKLRIDINVSSPGQTFWLDRIVYIPSADMPLDNRVLLLDNTDPAIHYDSQWTSLGGGANMTKSSNSVAWVEFIGVSVSWVAFIPKELPHSGAMGTWSIDGEKPTQFLLKGLPEDPTVNTQYHQFIFTTTEVEPGPHNLTVTFLGSTQTTPLCIDYLYVQNGTFPSPAGNNGTQPNNSSGSHIAAILGGVFGGLTFLLIMAAGILFWRRRRHKDRFAPVEGPRYSATPFNPYADYYSPTPNANTMIQTNQPQLYRSPGVSETMLLVPASDIQQQSSTMRKQHGASGRLEAIQPSTDNLTLTTHTRMESSVSSSLPRTTASAGGSVVRQHLDSGIRLNEGRIEDVPPQYTPE